MKNKAMLMPVDGPGNTVNLAEKTKKPRGAALEITKASNGFIVKYVIEGSDPEVIVTQDREEAELLTKGKVQDTLKRIA